MDDWPVDAGFTNPPERCATHSSQVRPHSPRDRAHATDEWLETRFDTASINEVVCDLVWAQSLQESNNASSAGFPKDSVSKRSVFMSLTRALKLFKLQSRSAMLLPAFCSWQSVLHMRERRRCIASFCQKMYVAAFTSSLWLHWKVLR
jgi:hypothetical protein